MDEIAVARLLLEIQRFQYEQRGEYDGELAAKQAARLLTQAKMIILNVELQNDREFIERLK